MKLIICVIAAALLACGTEAALVINTMHVISEIQARFAVTDTVAELYNTNTFGQGEEAVFTATLPERAYVANFSMEVDGQIFYGEVQDSQSARDRYEEAQRQGKTTGLVQSRPRQTNVFEVRAHIRPGGRAVFNMTYQEVLQREHGVYKHVVNIQPPYPVQDLQVDALIAERNRFTKIHVPKNQWDIGKMSNKELLRLSEDPNVEVRSASQRDGSIAYISYKPGAVQLDKGQLIVLYDVERDYSGGEIETLDGYFVHFIAPDTLPAGTKHVIFTLDTSGSMRGTKFQQLQSAMRQILNDMWARHPNDYFNVLLFNKDVDKWRSSSQPATRANALAAIDWIEQQKANGGTNIHAALTEALGELERQQSLGTLANMVLFLTDGQPTVGTTNEVDILNAVNGQQREPRQADRFAINCVAFGSEPNFDFIRTIAADNVGLARKIYIDSDAGVQLENFYDIMATPLITNMRVKYHGNNIEPGTLVKQDGKPLFSDGEVMIVGKMSQKNQPLRAEVTGKSMDDNGNVQSLTLEADSGRKAPCYPDPKQVPLRRGGFAIPTTRHITFCGPQLDEPFGVPDEFDINGDVPGSHTVAGYIERMWAYLTVQKLIEESRSFSLSQAEKDERADRALEMSLKYGLVNDLTSMVVVLPDGNERRLQMHSDTQTAGSGSATGSGSGPAPGPTRRLGIGPQGDGDIGFPTTIGATRVGTTTGKPGKCPTETTFLYDNESGDLSLFAPGRTTTKIIEQIRSELGSNAKFQFGRISKKRDVGFTHKITGRQTTSAVAAAAADAIKPAAARTPSTNGYIDFLRYMVRSKDKDTLVVVFTDRSTLMGRLGRTMSSMRNSFGVRMLFVNTSGIPFTSEKRQELTGIVGGDGARVIESAAPMQLVANMACAP